jgi:hypothetical protein
LERRRPSGALSRANIPQDTLREVKARGQTGRIISTFYGIRLDEPVLGTRPDRGPHPLEARLRRDGDKP